jgi:hypothetical protein
MVHAIARFSGVVLPLVLLASIGYRMPVAPAVPTDSGGHVERRLQRRRRRSLWLASVGIDNGPRVIHGVKVVA